MNEQTLLLIRKYNHCAIPDNHYAVSELMNNVNVPFIMDNRLVVLCVRTVCGIHNIQLFKFWVNDGPLS